MRQGVLEEINSTQLRNGGYAYRVKIDGKNYGCGFNPPQATVGDTVQYDTIQDGKYWKIAEGTLKKIEASSNNSITNSSQDSNTDRQLLIVRQSCIGYAIQTMEGPNLSVDDVIMKADDLVDYVFNGLPEYLEAEKEARMMEEINKTNTDNTDPLAD